jgi:hypothetical protein
MPHPANSDEQPWSLPKANLAVIASSGQDADALGPRAGKACTAPLHAGDLRGKRQPHAYERTGAEQVCVLNRSLGDREPQLIRKKSNSRYDVQKRVACGVPYHHALPRLRQPGRRCAPPGSGWWRCGRQRYVRQDPRPTAHSGEEASSGGGGQNELNKLALPAPLAPLLHPFFRRQTLP